LDMLDSTIRTSEEIEGILEAQEVSLLGIIPAIKTQQVGAMPLLVQSESDYHSSYERLLSKLRLLEVEGGEESVGYAAGPKVITLTSTQPQEGKSLSAYNMAIASARAGRRTLLIEADFRSASKATMLGLSYSSDIISEPLRYYGGQLGDTIQMVRGIENLYVCVSPGPQRQPTAIIESSEIQRFLRDARARFDMVILDTPALSNCDDALLLEPQTDGLMLIARPGIAEKTELDSTIESMEFSEDIRLLGVVVNAANIPVETKMARPEDTQGPIEFPLEPLSVPVAANGRIDF